MSLKKTLSTIPKNPIGIKNCGNNFKAKDVSLFNINSKFSIVYENCEKCLLKRHFQYKPNFFKIMEGVKRHLSQFPKNGIILKVSLKETLSIILKKLGLY